MQRIVISLLLIIIHTPATRAQLQAEIVPMASYPFMLSGKNKSNYSVAAARLQLSYKDGVTPLQPYLAAAIGATEFPLHNKQIKTLTMPVLNRSVKIGLQTEIKNNEFKRSVWTIAGGIGVSMLRPDEATLRMDGRETFLGYTTVKENPWFPQVELSLKWVCYPKPELGWYFGVQMLTEGIWLNDKKVRYTTVISQTEYNLNFNDIAVLASVGAVIGWRF